MKTFIQFIYEAKKEPAPKGTRYVQFLDMLRTPEYEKFIDNGKNFWLAFGHGYKDIESVKRRVFGNNLSKQKPELFWYHKTKGVITHPTHNDKNLTHEDIEGDLIYGSSLIPSRRKLVDDRVVSELGSVNNIVGRGRIEHRDDGTGIITYAHDGGQHESSVVRTLSRTHPSYMILNSYGQLL